MSQPLKPFLVALDDRPEVAELIAERAEVAGFEALALQTNRVLETTLAVAAADVLVVDCDAASQTLSAFARYRDQDQLPLVILLSEYSISGALTSIGLVTEVVATLRKPLSDDKLSEALDQALKGVSGGGSDG